MKYQELKIFASECQIAADEIAFNHLKFIDIVNILSVFQSKCDFNLFWLYSVAPEVVLHLDSISFLNENINKFKRKITAKEMLNYDLIIGLKNPGTFEEFKENLR